MEDVLDAVVFMGYANAALSGWILFTLYSVEERIREIRFKLRDVK